MFLFNNQILNEMLAVLKQSRKLKFTTNLGVDMKFYQIKLNVTMDYFIRETTYLLLQPFNTRQQRRVSRAPFINGGDIRNARF
jgi:hypothetical protein